MSILLTWSFHRIRHQLVFWIRLLRLVVDWTVALYIVVPALAFAIYEGHRYYSGTMLSGLHASTVVFGPMTIAVLSGVIAVVFVVGNYFSTYGNLPFPMQSGDRAYMLMAPIARWRLFVTFYLETAIWAALYLATMSVLLFPLLLMLKVTLSGWIARMALQTFYVSSARIFGILIRQNENPNLSDWVVRQLIRIGLLLPPLWVIPRIFVHTSLLTLFVFSVATVLLCMIVWRLQQRVSWDPLYRDASSRLADRILGTGKQLSPPTRASKTVSSWFVRTIERLNGITRKQGLHPVTWLLWLRVFRAKGLFWFYFRLSLGAIAAVHFIPILLIRYIAVGFLLFLFYQYWKTTIAELYVAPAKEQFVVPRYMLETVGSQLMYTAILLTAVLWVILGLL